MVRKQVYILPAQDEQLKYLAQSRETTEAELIRAAIDELIRQKSAAPVRNSLPIDQAAWQTILTFVDQRRATGIPGEPYQWKREDGYDDERYRRPWAQPVAEDQDPA
ncbi:MAG TPA: CopG family transcriptional regulator [Caldilineaceae bacterium]|nr:CopG family transcriptional regulator [Caldilineaceae bacterium]